MFVIERVANRHAGCVTVGRHPGQNGRKWCSTEGDPMYTFAVVALLSLAVLKVVDVLVEYTGMRDRSGLRSLLTFALAIGGVWLMDFDLFAGWNTSLRNDDIALWMTGFIVAGFTVAWRAVFGYLTHDKATMDESLGDHRELRKVA
jgi:hypothetical protein